ncbi:MAG TPA: DUF6585 family protein [Anaerolineaceae bacterium]|nr:DUF6585 family protein [Anaerolineaceae bacterium]
MTGWYVNKVPSQFSKVQGLGRPIDVFLPRQDFMVRIGPFLLAILTILAAIAVLAWGAFQTYQRYFRNGPAVIWRSLTLPLILAAVLILIGIAVAWIALTRLNRAVVLYERGVAISTLLKMRSWHWEDISSIQAAITRMVFLHRASAPSYVYTLTRRNGNKVTLDDTLDRIEVLGSSIREKATPYILARYSQALENGQILHFGPVQVSLHEGVRIGTHVYDWSQLDELAVLDGQVRVRLAPDGKLTTSQPPVMVYQVPNLDVLLSLANKR